MPVRRELYQPEISRGVRWFVTYWIEVNGTVQRVRRSRTYEGVNLNEITDLVEREAVAKQFMKEILLRLCPPVERPEQTRFLEALELAVALKHSNKAKTNKTFAETARWVGEFFTMKGWGSLRCGQVEFDHIQAYFDYIIVKLKVRNSTHNTRKNNLRSLFSELVRRGYFQENFVKTIPDRVVGDPLRRPFSKREHQVVARHLMQHDRALWLAFLLLGYLAIRPGEIRNLRVGSIDLKKGIVTFPGSESKNRRNSIVTIPAQIIPLLEAFNLHQWPENYFVFGAAKGRHNRDLLPRAERVGQNTLYNRFREVLLDLHRQGAIQNIRGLSLYSLKDTLALYLLENGVDVESAMRHFRHTSLEMFQRYVKRLGVVNEKIRELPVELPGFP